MFRKLAFILAVGLLTVGASAQTPGGNLQGVWKVVEVKTTGPNASTNSNPQPGMYIFTAKHYSSLRVTSDQPRPNQPADTSKATAAELMAVWNPFAANAGAYELAGGTLTQYPTVAKNPAVMATGAKNVFSVKLESNNLWMTSVSNTTGPVTNPSTIKLVRVE